MKVVFKSSKHILAMALLTALATSCSLKESMQADQDRSLPPFKNVFIAGDFNVAIEAGGQQAVHVQAARAHIDKLTTHVEGQTLYVEWHKDFSARFSKMPTLTLNAPSIEMVSVKGSASVEIDNIQNESTTLILDGSGSIYAVGQTNKLTVQAKGSGNITATELPAKTADVSLIGSGSVNVTVSDKLIATLNGSGDINVFGNPSNVQTELDGSGSINDMAHLVD